MYQPILKTRVLNLLANNISNAVSPDLVRCSSVAAQLKISRQDLRPILLALDKSGSIQCDLELNYALITTQGLQNL